MLQGGCSLSELLCGELLPFGTVEKPSFQITGMVHGTSRNEPVGPR